MPRRKDSFSRALADAQKRLEKAQGELNRASQKIADLNQEIPRLQVMIAALNPVAISPRMVAVLKQQTTITPPPPNLTPEELAKWYTERDLSGVSSIPPGGAKPPAKELSEAELLPDPDGKTVLE